MDYLYKNGDVEAVIEITQKNVKQDVAKQFAECRKARKMTQAQVAERAQIPRSNITRFESGTYNPSVEMLVRVAEALDMKLNINLEEKEAE